jgi:uncharacterized protein (TIGR02757 family)
LYKILKRIVLNKKEIKDVLEELHDRYNQPAFIESDPVSIPHYFTRKQDIEIAGFFSATLAWGQRSQIIKNANFLMRIMDYEPYEFIANASQSEFKKLDKFYYRTFKSVDAVFFVRVLKEIYKQGGLEHFCGSEFKNTGSVKLILIKLFEKFQEVPHELRSMKHIANVQRGASAKRLNMFLRWMIRDDKRGVDFGLWKEIPPSELFIPLDTHSGATARKLNLLQRKQNDWKAVEELTMALRNFDIEDPVKYDFALFGYGVNLK